jgi:hypothetical protein
MDLTPGSPPWDWVATETSRSVYVFRVLRDSPDSATLILRAATLSAKILDSSSLISEVRRVRKRFKKAKELRKKIAIPDATHQSWAAKLAASATTTLRILSPTSPLAAGLSRNEMERTLR